MSGDSTTPSQGSGGLGDLLDAEWDTGWGDGGRDEADEADEGEAGAERGFEEPEGEGNNAGMDEGLVGYRRVEGAHARAHATRLRGGPLACGA